MVRFETNSIAYNNRLQRVVSSISNPDVPLRPLLFMQPHILTNYPAMQHSEKEASPHDTLITWATSTQNVTINGIHPTTMPGKGLGMVATRDIKVCFMSSPHLVSPYFMM